MNGSLLLAVNELSISLGGERAEDLPVVDRVSFTLSKTESLGVVGESGSGKSMLCRSMIGTLRRHGAASVSSGSIKFDGIDLAGADEARFRSVRGRRIAYVPQSSLAALNPVVNIGNQLRSVVEMYPDGSKDWRTRALELLEMVRIDRPATVLKQRPHQLSGGMRQRVMIAAALAGSPDLLIADEPTTALDASIQAQILHLLRQIQGELEMAMIFVSHDLATIQRMCDRTLVMYAGAVVEKGPTRQLLSDPIHPYTRALHAAASLDVKRADELAQDDPPSVGNWPSGCRYAPRCAFRAQLPSDDCTSGEQPLPSSVSEGRDSACLYNHELLTIRASTDVDD